ncbi:MAG: nucleotide exchange factor GrpE [Planctomycetales bacterium]|nr:nucleotide exchange factor GrpE [Planctomycetales bacterium]
MSEKDQTKADKKISELEDRIKELHQQLEKLTAEKQETFEQLQRVSADYANYQKRIPKQIADSVTYEKKAILRSLLPSIDNFERALSHASAAPGEQTLDTLVKGIQLVFDHMLDTLKGHGVQRIEAMNQPFDPALHEAMMQRTEPDKPDNVVLDVYQAGYRMNDQVLRPCRVIINKLHHPMPAAGGENDETTDTESQV